MIYLDQSATTKPFSSVVESFTKVSEEYFGNPSSIHHLGGKSEKLLASARSQVADLLQVSDREVVFTSGGTEGNNLVIKGIALEHRNRGNHLITSEIEHPSVYDAFQQLETLGFEVTYLPVNEQGVVSVADVAEAITEETILISLMHVNNELGSIQPVEDIGKIVKNYPKLFFHVDAIQSIGKIPLKLANSGIDCCTMSGHKIHGLKGTGILYVNERVTLSPLLSGGSQEQGFRSGTENLAGAVSIARALRLIKERQDKESDHLYFLNQKLRKGFNEMDEVIINSPVDSAPHIMNVSVPGFKPEVIIHALGERDIFISTRSACSSKQIDKSRILSACGFNQERSTTALRISTSYINTKQEIETFLQTFQKVLYELKRVME